MQLGLFAAFLIGLSSSLYAMEVRVRIEEAIPKVRVRGFDVKIFARQHEEMRLVSSADKVSEWEIQCKKGEIQVQELTLRKPQVFKGAVSIQTPAGFLRVSGQPFRGEIRVYADQLCDVVNHVDLEKYLDGLVNAEFSSKWSSAAIAAQVVAARSYAYYQMQASRRNPSAYFDLDSTVKDQVYRGSKPEDFNSSQIVERTRGWVLTTTQPPSYFPLKAFYHSTCGGTTERPEAVWGMRFPGLNKSVSCGFCSTSPRSTWSLDLKTREIAQAILSGVLRKGIPSAWSKENLKLVQEQRLLDIQIQQMNAEGRVVSLNTLWGGGKTVVGLPITGVQFREWVGFQRFRSTVFKLTAHKKGKSWGWFFQGRGNGHGVGMCQWGAKVMGEKGYTMEAILKHYYPDAVLRKLW